MNTQAMRVLILGGTTEAMQLAHLLCDTPAVDPVFSFAGRTKNPVMPPIACRIGGFGGVAGLIDYLRNERIEALVDATHPFAAQISANAAQACAALNTPICALTRAPWLAGPGDHWTEVVNNDAAVEALGENPARVFLTIGRLHLEPFGRAPHHHYLIRSIDDPGPLSALPHYKLILARPDFTVADEIELMREEKIEILVTKNSGATSTYPKLAAARALGLRVVMIQRPKPASILTLNKPAAVIEWLNSLSKMHHDTP